MSQQMQSRT